MSIKRFYDKAGVAEAEAGFAVALDQRRLRTPAGAPFAAPTRALADVIAEEWNAQGGHIVPASMPLTQLGFAAIDFTAKGREERAAYVASFVETDLCCHRAETPERLIARQGEHWDPLVAHAHERFGAAPPVVTGILAADSDPVLLQAVRDAALGLDDFRLTVLAQAAGLAGSALIAFAMLDRRIDGAEAFAAAALDELWSQETWGEDAEARVRLDRQRAEFDNLHRFICALEAP